MKGLLQSERFKKNLSKWLCMYIGVMLLLTTVITYSKYISSFMGKDEARAAKFNVKINSTGCVFDTTKESCDSGVYFRDDAITYFFTVDTREIEAAAEFVLSISVHEQFAVEKIMKGTSTLCEKENCKLNSQNVISLLTNQKETEDIQAGRGTITDYQVTVKFTGDDDAFKEFNYQSQSYQIVNLGYSAIQKN